jgi:anthranilate synthase component 1
MRERVLVWPVDGPVDAEAVFLSRFADAEHAVWLDSTGAGADGRAGWSMLAAPERVVDADELRERHGSVFDGIRAVWAVDEVDTRDVPGPFSLGFVGWLGYELHAETLGIMATRRSRYPDAVLLPVDRALVIDHGDGDRGWLLARGESWDHDLAPWRDAMLRSIAAASVPGDLQGHPSAPVPGAATAAWATTDAEYLDRIRQAKHTIADGDAYQLCLTTEADIPGSFDEVEVYLRMRRSSPSHHGAFLRADGVALLSASPEQFISITPDGVVQTKPIKGTRQRGDTPAEDVALADELRASDKERAENLMIVDLMRNDLSRVCEIGSVEVTSLLAVETYPHVHQLVSTVRGQLGDGRDAVDVLRACFPAGSMTGAPKRSAVEILDRLEGRARGVYAGAFGYLGYDGAVDLAMVIRSIVVDARGATIGAGGGITALSVPEEEVAEVRLKAAALLGALGVK